LRKKLVPSNPSCVLPGLAIVRPMYDDDYRVTSELYRLMPPRKRAGSGDLGEALDAARVTGPELREALDAANGTVPEPADDIAIPWPDTRRHVNGRGVSAGS